MASGRVYDAIRAYLDGAWLLTPVAWENEERDRDGNPLPPNPAQTFVEVELTGTAYDIQSLGENPPSANRWDEEGILFLNVLIPKGTGASAGRTLAKKLIDLFRGKLLLGENLQFREASIGQGRPALIDGNWWMIPTYVRWRLVDEPIDIA